MERYVAPARDYDVDLTEIERERFCKTPTHLRQAVNSFISRVYSAGRFFTVVV
jgi:hypothetical protein